MLNLYTETPFQVKPSTASSLISFQIPSHNGSYQRSKFSPRVPAKNERPAFKDEQTFVKRYYATQSSIYYRRSRVYPRSFLWRVVNGERVLEIQCADLARSENDQYEAHLTLSLEFQDEIAPHGVAMSDPEGLEILTVFVITANKELHTLSVPTDFFRVADATNGDVRRWHSSAIPSTFVIDQPHYLYANTAFEIFISYDSGRLQRLTRNAGDDGSYWAQDNFDEKSWGASIRGIVARRGNKAIELGSRLLDPLTAHAIVASADSTFVYTVCLNHTLRVWNLTTGKLVASKDLLNQSRQPQENISLAANAPAFVRLFKAGPMNHPILVTFSPHNGAEFKFWDIKGGRTEPLVVEDKFPNNRLSPPDPDPSGNSIWSMTGFEIRPGDTQKPTELWVLWQNNKYHQLYSIHFDFHSLPELWETNWVRATVESRGKTSVPDLVRSDPRDTTEKWVEFLFWPERYPSEVLETSLSIYEDAMQSRMTTAQKGGSLLERLCSSIASGVTLRKYADSDMDYELFTSNTDSQWRNYYRIVETVNEGRQGPLSLCLDTYSDIPWITMSDQCCAVRECSQTELLKDNDSSDLKNVEDLTARRWPHRKISADSGEPLQAMSALVKMAGAFRNSFPPEIAKDTRSAIEEELLQNHELPVPSRIYDFYERCNFAEAISNETYDMVLKDLEQIGGFQGLSNELIFGVLDTLPEARRGPRSALQSTIFGSKVISAGLQDTISLGRQLVFDLIVLVIFVECEINQEDNRSVEFDASELFVHLLDLLKEYEKKFWLNSHIRLVPLEFPGPETSSNTARTNEKTTLQNGCLVTVLYDTLGKAVRPQPAIGVPQSSLLTGTLEEIESWVGGSDQISFDDGLVYIQCDLLAQKNIDLATDFLRFQPNTPWSTYVKGRLYLARSEFDRAAFYFQAAAYSLAYGKAVGSLIEMSAGLLSMIDTECFYNGLPRYFQHILALFEPAKAFGFVSEFARLALRALSVTAPKEARASSVALRSEILSRLFTAELKCSRFLGAYTALTQFTDHALQKSSMTILVTAILDPKSDSSSSGTQLGPVDGLTLLTSLPIALHPEMARHMDNHLVSQAKKQSSIFFNSSGLSMTTTTRIDFLSILHCLRVEQGDHRGALPVLLDRLLLVKKSSRARNDPQARELRRALLELINALSCVEKEEAYVIADVEEPGQQFNLNSAEPGSHHMDVDDSNETDGSTGWKKPKKVVITLDDLRREYQGVLDKCARIERGDFEFADDDDASDFDEEGDGGEAGGVREVETRHGEAMEM